MINKKIVLSLLSIVSALVIVGGATFAFFSSTATSNDNIFAAGTLTLELDDEDEPTPASTVTASFGDGTTLLAPGDTQSGFVSVNNTGTIDIDEVTMTGLGTDTDGDGMTGALEVTDLRSGTDSSCSGSTDHLAGATAVFGDGAAPLTLAEFDGVDIYQGFPGVAAGGTYFICMGVTFDSGAGNVLQGDSAELDLTFTGNQDSSQ